MRVILLLMALSFAAGAAGGPRLVLAFDTCNGSQCWNVGCNGTDGDPNGCEIGFTCRYIEDCPPSTEPCTLSYGWCHTQNCNVICRPGEEATSMQCEDEYACEGDLPTFCEGLSCPTC